MRNKYSSWGHSSYVDVNPYPPDQRAEMKDQPYQKMGRTICRNDKTISVPRVEGEDESHLETPGGSLALSTLRSSAENIGTSLRSRSSSRKMDFVFGLPLKCLDAVFVFFLTVILQPEAGEMTISGFLGILSNTVRAAKSRFGLSNRDSMSHPTVFIGESDKSTFSILCGEGGEGGEDAHSRGGMDGEVYNGAGVGQV